MGESSCMAQGESLIILPTDGSTSAAVIVGKATLCIPITVWMLKHIGKCCEASLTQEREMTTFSFSSISILILWCQDSYAASCRTKMLFSHERTTYCIVHWFCFLNYYRALKVVCTISLNFSMVYTCIVSVFRKSIQYVKEDNEKFV